MSYETDDPQKTRARLQANEGWVYLDVRSVPEFEEGHVPGAYNVPLLHLGPAGMEPNADFVDIVRRHFEPGTKLVIGCKAGGRSARACEMLAAHGFENLVNMFGGFHGAVAPTGQVMQKGWEACGFETTQQPEPGRSWDELRGV